jgi:hypothetical protein
MSEEKSSTGATGPEGPTPETPRKPWPMSWVLIVVLAYIALQTAYFLFYGD